MKSCAFVIATGLALAVADPTLPGPAPDGVTALGVTMIGFGLAGIALLRSTDDGHR